MQVWTVPIFDFFSTMNGAAHFGHGSAIGIFGVVIWWITGDWRPAAFMVMIDGVVGLLFSSLTVEVGDTELRAGLQEVRELLGAVRGHARELVRVLGR